MSSLASTWESQDGSIRITPQGQPSVFDLIRVLGGQRNPQQAWSRLIERHPRLLALCENFKFPGRGQRETPVATTKEAAYQILGLLPSVARAKCREQSTDLFARFLGDPDGFVADLGNNLLTEFQACLKDPNAQFKADDRQSRGYLYVIQRSDTGLVKIGISGSPEKRKRNIESASGSPTLLIATVETVNPAEAERSLHDELKPHRRHGEWFDLPASKLLGLITALSSQNGFKKVDEPFIPATLMRTVEDIQILACAGFLPVDTDPETGEYKIEEYKNYGHLVVSLAGPKNERNAFSASVAYDQDGQFIPHSWRLCESYSGSMSNKYHPMLDVRVLMESEHFFDFEPIPEAGGDQ